PRRRHRGRVQQRRGARPGRPAARGAGVGAARGAGRLARGGARAAAPLEGEGRAHAQAPPAAPGGAQPPVRGYAVGGGGSGRGPAMTSGFVSLVGAGPGDPDLLTRKAARRLAEADLVLYDALVSPTALELAGRARRFYVGKRAGRPHVAQDSIHRLM